MTSKNCDKGNEPGRLETGDENTGCVWRGDSVQRSTKRAAYDCEKNLYIWKTKRGAICANITVQV